MVVDSVIFLWSNSTQSQKCFHGSAVVKTGKDFIQRIETMPKMTIAQIEEALQKEVQAIDKSVKLVAVQPGKKKDCYRLTLIKDGKSGSAELKKDVIKRHLAGEGQGRQLRKALGKAVSHLSIKYSR